MLARVHKAVVWMRRAAEAPVTRAAFFCLCALWVLWPLFGQAGALNEFRDGQVMYNYEDVAVRTVRQWLQWPLWNPYYCGGIYALGTPQSRFAAPPFLLSLLFGAQHAAPIAAFAMSVLGMEGFFRYARTRTGSALGPALIAPLFALNGFMAFSYFSGWINFYGFLLLPWVLFALDALLRERRYALLVFSCSFGFIVGYGGTYAGPLAALLALAHLVRVFVERPDRMRDPHTYARLALALCVALLVSAVRLWPIVESMIAAPRLMAGAPGESAREMLQRMLYLSRPDSGNYGTHGQQYVGAAFAALCALGVSRRRSVPALVLGLLAFWVSLGYAATPSAFGALRQLPVLSVLRYPERFLFLVCLLGAEVAALGIDRCISRARRMPKVALPMLAVSLVLVVVALAQEARNQVISARGMWLGPAPLQIERPFAQARGNRWLIAHYASISRGSLSCWEAYPVPMSELLRGDLAQEEYLLDADAGTVTRKSWSPNALTLDVDVNRPTSLLINQNYHPGWRSSLGRPHAHQGLLALALPAGKRTVTLHFMPRSALFGALLSLCGVLAGVAAYVRRKRLLGSALLAAPLLVLCAFTLYAEPLPQRPPELNADGSPMLVSELPENARAVGTEFEVPLVLEGASIDKSSRADGTARVELFWRVKGRIPRDVGIVVHFQSEKRIISSEHDVIGASVLLPDAPREQLLRDSVSAVLDGAPDEHWKIWVCLWRVHGDKSRLTIRDANNQPLDADRVLIGGL